MQITDETETHLIVESELDGKPMTLYVDKKDGSYLMDMGTYAYILGYKSEGEMIADDGFLDILNKIKAERGEYPIKRMTIPKIAKQ